MQRFVNFFLEKYQRHVCHADRLEFINGWYVLVIISDMMTIVGSILKMEIKAKVRVNILMLFLHAFNLMCIKPACSKGNQI